VSRAARRGERGFTLLEVLVALLVTIIGLAGVLMMQANTARANRENAEFTHASMIAEETMEGARGMNIDTLLNTSPISYGSQTDRGITYNITLTAARIATGSNLVLITSAVTYSEDKDTSTADDRTARFQLIRTYTEQL
jgi:prepilin-type N-terminal cleavage/methylation domain-containing protein